MHVEIPKAKDLEQKVFNIHNAKQLESVALEIYHYQFYSNKVYREYCEAIRRTPETTGRVGKIPFLPISFFKSHQVSSGDFLPQEVFTSSGTTGMTASKHYVRSRAVYEESFTTCFRNFYGDIDQYCILGLLPSYLERGGSSLVYMVDHLIRQSGHELSGFYLDDLERLHHTMNILQQHGQKVLLIGVTYALLDFGRAYPGQYNNCIVVETGGMKGRAREITRMELYEQLRKSFGIKQVHAEYGMTELLSQAYAIDGLFKTPPWMKVCLRDETDPLDILPTGGKPVTGAINIIDLANIHSCSFIATDDMGRLHPGGSFEVLGRLDNSDTRGCSLLVV